MVKMKKKKKKQNVFINSLGPSFFFPSILSAYFLFCGCTNYGIGISTVILLVVKMAIMTKEKSFVVLSVCRVSFDWELCKGLS